MRVVGVVPVHNHAVWVLDALASLDAQTRPLDGIAVVDDGSRDNSSEVIIRYAGIQQSSDGMWKGVLPKTQCPVVLLRHELPKGPAAARNVGFELFPDADVYALLDSDDVYGVSKVEKSLLYFEDSSVGVVYSDYETVRADGLILRQYKEPFSRERLLRECIINCDSLVRRSYLEKVGFFDESLRVCEDLDLWLRLTEVALAVHIPEALVAIRVGGHSSTDTVRSETWKACYSRAHEKLKQRTKGLPT